ncbi:hypothetical protein HYS94_04985 [Candidatus Daviesbacteria bacterium]|nr:hypothetical protein [Candidatus Daviesbacteria bacterium]
MQKGFAPLLIIVGILVVGLIAGGAYYLGSVGAPKPQTPVVNQTPQPTADETANWKTYTNENLEFTIKYPSDWTVHEFPVDTQYKLLHLIFTSRPEDIKLSTNYNSRNGFTITVNTSLHNQDTLQREGRDKGPNFAGFNYNQTTFLDLPANRAYMTYSDMISDTGAGISWLYFNKGSYGWTLGWPNTDFEGHYDSVYDQILSTFRFD